MRQGACKSQGDGMSTKQEAPGFGVGLWAAKLKRQTSHTKFMAHQVPPSPVYGACKGDSKPPPPAPSAFSEA